MKKDLTNRDDIEVLINVFYSKVLADNLLSPVFNEKLMINWERHIPLMCDFWENMLFYTGPYKGNPMILHQHLNRVHAIRQEHFDKWLEIFLATVSLHFKGPMASLAKKKAKSLAKILSEAMQQHFHDVDQ
jgi:hemoglobin